MTAWIMIMGTLLFVLVIRIAISFHPSCGVGLPPPIVYLCCGLAWCQPAMLLAPTQALDDSFWVVRWLNVKCDSTGIVLEQGYLIQYIGELG